MRDENDPCSFFSCKKKKALTALPQSQIQLSYKSVHSVHAFPARRYIFTRQGKLRGDVKDENHRWSGLLYFTKGFLNYLFTPPTETLSRDGASGPSLLWCAGLHSLAECAGAAAAPDHRSPALCRRADYHMNRKLGGPAARQRRRTASLTTRDSGVIVALKMKGVRKRPWTDHYHHNDPCDVLKE